MLRTPEEEGIELLDIIDATAILVREALEPMWPVWRRIVRAPFGPTDSYQSCVPSSFALRASLERVVPEYRWRVQGGRPTKRSPIGGYRDSAGRAHPHLWVEGSRRGYPVVVVDITADQFGGPPVIVQVNGERRHCANATRTLLDRYSHTERVTVDLFVGAIDHYIRAKQREDSSSGRSVSTSSVLSAAAPI